VGEATVFVSWFLDTKIATLLDALAHFLEQKGLSEAETFFWVCDNVIRQTDVKPDLTHLGDCVSAIGHTVLLLEPWNDPQPLKRAYCIKEVYHTQASGATFDMVMSTEQQQAFERALVTPYGDDSFDSIKEGLSRVDVRQVRAQHTLVAFGLRQHASSILYAPSLRQPHTSFGTCVSSAVSDSHTGGLPQCQGQGRHSGRAGEGRGLRQVQRAGRRLAARGPARSGAGGVRAAAGS
jgi:hypothetical protein